MLSVGNRFCRRWLSLISTLVLGCWLGASQVQAQSVAAPEELAGQVAGASTDVRWSVPMADSQAWSRLATQLIWYRFQLEPRAKLHQDVTVKAQYGEQLGELVLRTQGVVVPAQPGENGWQGELQHQGTIDWQAARLDVDLITRQVGNQSFVWMTAFPPVGSRDSRPWLKQWWSLPIDDTRRAVSVLTGSWQMVDQGLSWRPPEIRWHERQLVWPFQLRLGQAQLASQSWWLPPDCVRFQGQGVITVRWGVFVPQAYQFDGRCVSAAGKQVLSINVIGTLSPPETPDTLVVPPDSKPWQEALAVPQGRPAELPPGRR